MNDTQMSLKKHVHAAREWLGEAEVSIDDDDAIRGDLSLMLAQAELTHAKETAKLTASQKWARRIAPAVCAVVIAVALWAAWPAARIIAPAAPAAPPLEAASSRQSVNLNGAGVGIAMPQADATDANANANENENVSSYNMTEKIEPSSEVENEIIYDRTEEKEIIEEKIISGSEVPEAETNTAYSTSDKHSQPVNVPSEEMQKLMSTAAEHLRAQ